MRRRHWLASTAALGAGWAAATAGAGWTGAGRAAAAGLDGIEGLPAPGAPRPLLLPAPAEQRLANGLRVVVAPRRGLPLVSVTLLIFAGRERETAGRAGLAELTAALLAKGARRGRRVVGAADLVREAEALGGSLETASGWRSIAVSMTVTTPRQAAALALLADVVRRPLLADDEFERARTQALDGLRVALAAPGQVAALAARRAFWGEGPYAAAATPASLQRLAADEVRNFHAAMVRPDRAALVLAGDLDAEQAQRLAESLLGDWARPSAPLPDSVLASASPVAAPTVLVAMPGSGQCGVVLAAPYVGLGSPLRRAAELANELMGGFSGRLNQVVRVQRGLSYGVSTGAEAHPGGGRWTAQAQTQHASAGEVLALLREQTLRLADEAPAAAELAARQAALLGGFARRLETTAGLAAALGGLLVQERPLADLARYPDEVRAVTPEQVREFAAAHWRAPSLRAVVAGDLQAAGEALRQAAPGALVRPLDALDLERADLARR